MYTHILHRLSVYGSLDILLHYMLYSGKCLPHSCWCFLNPKWYLFVIHHSHGHWRLFSPTWYLELVCHMHRRRAADHCPPAKTYHCLHWWTWVGLKDMTKMVNVTHFKYPSLTNTCVVHVHVGHGDTVEALKSGHPWEAKKVFITGAGHWRECKNTEFLQELRKTGFCEFKAAVSRAVCLRECALGELPLISWLCLLELKKNSIQHKSSFH